MKTRPATTTTFSSDIDIEAALRIAMDDYMFRYYVNECRTVYEDTGYVEIFNYSVCHSAVMEPAYLIFVRIPFIILARSTLYQMTSLTIFYIGG